MGNIKIIGGSFDTKLELEHAGVAAGFPSPADEYRHETLDFRSNLFACPSKNRDYIRHPEASFYGDVEGDSMKDAGLLDGDRVIIDRAVEPHDGSIVVGELTVAMNYAIQASLIILFIALGVAIPNVFFRRMIPA